MDWLKALLHSVLHFDDSLAQWTSQFGIWIYAILFLIVFCETGLVVTPFLPGDSLLFAAGALAAQVPDGLNVHLVVVILLVAAILGDTVNYHLGAIFGHKVANGNRFIKKEHLDKTHAFFEKYGPKTIVIARFVPIVRTFAPFVAGLGAMTYRKFIVYNIAGAVIWVGALTYTGYAVGNVPWVKHNFEKIVLGIIFVSILPAVIEVLRAKAEAKRNAGK